MQRNEHETLSFAQYAAQFTSSDWLHNHLMHWPTNSLAEVMLKLIELQAPVTEQDIAELAGLWNDWHVQTYGPAGTPIH